jgi:hypothetical protein
MDYASTSKNDISITSSCGRHEHAFEERQLLRHNRRAQRGRAGRARMNRCRVDRKIDLPKHISGGRTDIEAYWLQAGTGIIMSLYDRRHN